MLTYTLNRHQYIELEALSYYIADLNYMKSNHAADALEEIEDTRKSIERVFDKLDALEVPFWVQNIICCVYQDWTEYKRSYVWQILEERKVYVV